MSSVLESFSVEKRAEIHDALSSPRRLHILRLLAEAGTSLTLANLAREIARIEQDRSQVGVTAEQTKEMQISLHHIHIPRLIDADLVEYDKNKGRVGMRDTVPRDVLENFN